MNLFPTGSRLAVVLGVLIGTVVLATGWYRSVEDRFWRDRLPAELGRVSTEYRKTADYGFGPGGNSAGVILYRLPAHSADALLENGIGPLEPVGARSGSRSWRFRNWRPTPVVFDERWTRHGDHLCGQEPGIGAFVDYAAFRCDVDPAVVARVNRISSRPGAYYAYGRAGSVILVAPRERLVILAFNG